MLGGILNQKKVAPGESVAEPEDYEEVKYAVTLPAHELHSFECDEGEVNVVKYHKGGRYFATGGSGE